MVGSSRLEKQECLVLQCRPRKDIPQGRRIHEAVECRVDACHTMQCSLPRTARFVLTAKGPQPQYGATIVENP